MAYFPVCPIRDSTKNRSPDFRTGQRGAGPEWAAPATPLRPFYLRLDYRARQLDEIIGDQMEEAAN